MKKLITSFLLLSAVILSSCSTPMFKTSDPYISLGKKAVEVMDDYLDFDISIEEARSRMGSVYNRTNELPEVNANSEYKGDYYLKIEFELAYMHFVRMSYGTDSDDYQTILDYRNSIAKDLGMGTRS